MGVIRNALTALAIAIGSASFISAQESPKEQQKQEQKIPAGFQFSMPDDAFPDKKGYTRIKGGMPTGDYDGKAWGGDARLTIEPASTAVRISGYRGDTNPATTPYTSVIPLPEMGDNPVQTLENKLKHKSGELGLGIEKLKLFGKYGKLEKELYAGEFSVLTDDEFFYLAVDTRLKTILESKAATAGVGYDFGQISAQIAGFTSKERNKSTSTERSIFTDKGSGMTFENITETENETKQVLAGALPNITYFVDKDLVLDFHAIIAKRKTESGNDEDKDTIFRPIIGGSWSNIFARAGFTNKNRYDKNQFIGIIGYVLDLGDVQIPGMAGIDDNENVYGGGMIVVGGNADHIRNFMLFLPDNTISPLETEIMKEQALSHRTEGLARSTTLFAGTYVRKVYESKINEDGSIDVSKELTFVPVAGLSAGPLTLAGSGFINKEHQSGEAGIWVMPFKYFGLGIKARFTSAKDSPFDDEIVGLIELVGRY
ncbi:MAG: hypothetical protein QXR48_04095 [Candidatus Woesearchaeota archaeon]